MASLLSIRRRIMAAQNVSKTTRAMQMIAASKLKRAQNAALSARAYAEKLTSLSQNLTSSVEEANIHPYINTKLKVEKSLVIIIAPDKGLCGGLITNLMKEFIMLQSKDVDFEYLIIGRKIESKITHLSDGQLIASFSIGTTIPTFDMVYPVTRIIDEHFIGNRVGSVKILYSSFVSIFTQTPKIETLLPITIQQEGKTVSDPYIFEPSLNVLLPSILRHYLEMSIYRILLESFASEQASRMIAMQNATTNAKEVIEELRLEYNKSRQAKITNEILDISNTGEKAN